MNYNRKYGPTIYDEYLKMERIKKDQPWKFAKCLEKGERLPKHIEIEFLKISNSPQWWHYVEYNIQGRWLELEKFIELNASKCDCDDIRRYISASGLNSRWELVEERLFNFDISAKEYWAENYSTDCSNYFSYIKILLENNVDIEFSEKKLELLLDPDELLYFNQYKKEVKEQLQIESNQIKQDKLKNKLSEIQKIFDGRNNYENLYRSIVSSMNFTLTDKQKFSIGLTLKSYDLYIDQIIWEVENMNKKPYRYQKS